MYFSVIACTQRLISGVSEEKELNVQNKKLYLIKIVCSRQHCSTKSYMFKY